MWCKSWVGLRILAVEMTTVVGVRVAAEVRVDAVVTMTMKLVATGARASVVKKAVVAKTSDFYSYPLIDCFQIE